MADEAVVDAAVAESTPTETPVGNIPVDLPVTHTETPQADEFTPLEQVFDELGKEEKPAEVQTEATPSIPEEFQKALGISEWVKEPAQVEQAIRAADEVWKVQTGQSPAWTMIESVKQYDPARYEAIIGELIPYIEKATGQKFGGQSEQVDPVQQLRNEIQQRDVQAQQQRQQQEYNQQVQRATAITETKVTEMLKGTILEGQGNWLVTQVAQHIKITPQQLLKEVVSGNTKTLEAGVKAAMKEETARIAKINKQIIANHRAKKGALPASRTNPVTPVAQSGDAPDLSTAAARVKWMTEQFKSGAAV